ncbi:MAG: hypothetical protein RL517_334 [Pseudomonadota bacterium]|jgi:hypothetical protein
MQPPIIGVNLREAVNRLVQEATATAKSTPHPQSIKSSISDGYVNQILIWCQNLTPSQLSRSYTLEEVMALNGLKGRYREQASVRYTAEALKRCGFKQKRDWTVAGRNKRFWVKGD